MELEEEKSETSEKDESHEEKGASFEKEPSVEEEEEVDPRDLLTKEQVDYYKKIFNEFDPQKKQKIPAKTIGYVLRFMGLNPTKKDIKKHILEIDPLCKGLIDFESFLLPIAQRVNQMPETHEDIIAAFEVLDEEKNGYVYTDKLVEYLTTLGEDLEDYELEALLRTADPKGLNKVYYVEFVEKLMGVVRGGKKKGKKGKKK